MSVAARSVAENGNASLVLDRHVEEGRGGRLAYVTAGESLTYEELLRQAARMGRLLRELGVRREERVLLVLDDTLLFPVAFLGAMRVGAVPVPVSVRERAENFRHFIEDSYAQVVVCDAAMLPELRSALAGFDLRFLVRGVQDGAIELDAALAAQDDELAAAAVHPDDMAFWLYTSGSTGKPKGVVHLHHTMAITCESFARGALGMNGEDRAFSSTKLYHAYGLGNSLSYPLHLGATAVLMEGTPTPERLLATLREQRPTVYFSVPALYRALVSDRDADGAFDSVRLCVTAAEPLPVRTFEQWRERFGLELVDGIGCTEMVVGFCSNRPGDVVPGTTGVAVPGYELRLTDEAGVELAGPATGVLEVRGGSCAAFYWHRSEQSRRSMRGEWFVTGDRFRRREDGRYVYVGRADDMLKVAGLWVSPVDMENVLMEHPAVAGAGVVGVTVDDYSRIAAFVECEPGASAGEDLRDSLRAWCRERLREYEYPHVIRFVAELPRTHNGKPERFRLRELIEREPPAAAAGDATDRAAAGAGQRIIGLPEGEREQAALELVLAETAAVLGEGPVRAEEAHHAFIDLGFDSLSSVELRNRLEQATGLELPSTLIFDFPSPLGLARLLRARLEGAEEEDLPVSAETAEQRAELEAALERLAHPPGPPRMPPASPSIRLKTSWLRALVPPGVAVRRAESRARRQWERKPGERESARAAMEAIVAGTPREGELEELAREHFIERHIDRALFWQRPWTARSDAESSARLREALAGERGVLLSSCHLGPYYRLHCPAPFAGHPTYLLPGPWFFEPPSHDYWGRRLARWSKGMKSRPVPARGSFRIIQALLGRGEAVFNFFDMPGPRETRFLGRPAMLAEGSALLAARADALVLPLRARREGHAVWVDAGAPLDPRELGADGLHDALAAVHEAWILERPAAMEDPRSIGWGQGATAGSWTAG